MTLFTGKVLHILLVGLGSLRAITRQAEKLDIFRPVRATPNQGSDVINGIASADATATINASFILRLKDIGDVIGRVPSFCAADHSFPFCSIRLDFRGISPTVIGTSGRNINRVFSIVFPRPGDDFPPVFKIVQMALFGMTLFICGIVLTLLFEPFRASSLSPLATSISPFIFVCGAILCAVLAFAGLTPPVVSISCAGVWGKFTNRPNKPALCTPLVFRWRNLRSAGVFPAFLFSALLTDRAIPAPLAVIFANRFRLRAASAGFELGHFTTSVRDSLWDSFGQGITENTFSSRRSSPIELYHNAALEVMAI